MAMPDSSAMRRQASEGDLWQHLDAVLGTTFTSSLKHFKYSKSKVDGGPSSEPLHRASVREICTTKGS